MTTDTLTGSSSDDMTHNACESLRSVEGGMAALSPTWQDQDEVLRSLWEDNKTPEEIAVALSRSVAAIMTRAARLGLPRRCAPGRKRGYKRTDVRRKVMPAAGTRVRVALPAAPEEDVEPYTPPQIKMRVCLMCLNKFQSNGSHNRICPSCKGSAEYVTGSCTPDFAFKVIS